MKNIFLRFFTLLLILNIEISSKELQILHMPESPFQLSLILQAYNENCKFTIGDGGTIDEGNCINILESNNTFICTPHKKICKTRKDILTFINNESKENFNREIMMKEETLQAKKIKIPKFIEYILGILIELTIGLPSLLVIFYFFLAGSGLIGWREGITLSFKIYSKFLIIVSIGLIIYISICKYLYNSSFFECLNNILYHIINTLNPSGC